MSAHDGQKIRYREQGDGEYATEEKCPTCLIGVQHIGKYCSGDRQPTCRY
jgi:hypothetical protein